MRKTLKSRTLPGVLAVVTVRHKRQEGKAPREGWPATAKGKPLKAKAQGRYRREIKPEGAGGTKRQEVEKT
jgi:hypothetical protein